MHCPYTYQGICTCTHPRTYRSECTAVHPHIYATVHTCCILHSISVKYQRTCPHMPMDMPMHMSIHMSMHMCTQMSELLWYACLAQEWLANNDVFAQQVVLTRPGDRCLRVCVYSCRYTCQRTVLHMSKTWLHACMNI